MIKKHIAFTLAEILIVIGIIGIIAESTIPTILQDVKARKYKAYALKMQSQLESVDGTLLSESGGSLIGAYSSGSEFFNALASKFSYTSRADDTASAQTTCYSAPSVLQTRGPNVTITPNACVKLADGGFLSYIVFSGPAVKACKYNNTTCYALMVDMNGFDSPNMFFKDITLFGIGNDRLYVNLTYGPSLNITDNGQTKKLDGSIPPSDY